nr:MAG TPA: Major head protein [Caudoviricetes sp.]
MPNEINTQEEQQQAQAQVQEESKEPVKVEFTKEQQDHINKLISQQRSKAIDEFKKTEEEKKSESKRLSKMNENEQLKYQLDKVTAELEKANAVKERYEMEKVATEILNENNLPSNKQILDFVVRSDAEQTQDAIKTLSKLVNDTAEAILKERNKSEIPTRGNTPVKASWEQWK